MPAWFEYNNISKKNGNSGKKPISSFFESATTLKHRGYHWLDRSTLKMAAEEQRFNDGVATLVGTTREKISFFQKRPPMSRRHLFMKNESEAEQARGSGGG